MANELQVVGQLTFAKSPLPSKTVGSTSPIFVTVAGDDYKDNIQVISSTTATANEAVTFGDIGTPGYCFLENLDSTNTIYIQPITGGTETAADNLIELGPGEIAIFRIYNANKTMGAYASAGTPQLRVVIFET